MEGSDSDTYFFGIGAQGRLSKIQCKELLFTLLVHLHKIC